MMGCKYSQPTDKPWFHNKPNGIRTVRCYLPGGFKKLPYCRYATLNDEFDPRKPPRPQIIPDAPYVSVRECRCNPKCPYYKEKRDADHI